MHFLAFVAFLLSFFLSIIGALKHGCRTMKKGQENLGWMELESEGESVSRKSLGGGMEQSRLGPGIRLLIAIFNSF